MRLLQNAPASKCVRLLICFAMAFGAIFGLRTIYAGSDTYIFSESEYDFTVVQSRHGTITGAAQPMHYFGASEHGTDLILEGFKSRYDARPIVAFVSSGVGREIVLSEVPAVGHCWDGVIPRVTVDRTTACIRCPTRACPKAHWIVVNVKSATCNVPYRFGPRPLMIGDGGDKLDGGYGYEDGAVFTVAGT